jgi:allantoicase
LSAREAGFFHHYYIDIGQLEQFSSAFLAIYPDGTIPAVMHDGFVMTEINADHGVHWGPPARGRQWPPLET